ncbi:hypothetical protein PMAYCL1PPCAC_08000, partial [Pristionchus mayeri]
RPPSSYSFPSYPTTVAYRTMDDDENPYQAQFDNIDQFFRSVVLPQHLDDHVYWNEYMNQLNDPDVDIPAVEREEDYSEDFSPSEYSDEDSDSSRSRTASETSSTFTAPEVSLSEACISNQMHNKYALSPETSAYANELAGIFDDGPFGNIDDPENLRHTVRHGRLESTTNFITVPQAL